MKDVESSHAYSISSCIFFQREQHQDVTLPMLISEILSQLIDKDSDLMQFVPQDWPELQKYGSLPPIQSLRSVLIDCLKKWKSSYLICDALDECPDKIRRSFILELFKLQELCPDFRLLFASRDHILAEGTPLEHSPFLFIRATEEDLTTYIQHEVANRESFRDARRDKALKDLLIRTLIREAEGM